MTTEFNKMFEETAKKHAGCEGCPKSNAHCKDLCVEYTYAVGCMKSGYKKAIIQAKEWLDLNVHKYLGLIKEEKITASTFRTKQLLDDFDTNMNKILEDKKMTNKDIKEREVSEIVYNVFGKETYYDTWCFIYDTQMKSGRGIMNGFNCYLEFMDGDFIISDGWDTISEINSINNGSAIPFSHLLKKSIEKFATCYLGGTVGIRSTKK